jgi:hypothetical protein
MDTIWKFPLEIIERQIVTMPLDAKPLTIQVQGGTPTLWARVDDSQQKVQREVIMVGTGWPMKDRNAFDYLGTVQEGPFVWHYFFGEVVG